MGGSHAKSFFFLKGQKRFDGQARLTINCLLHVLPASFSTASFFGDFKWVSHIFIDTSLNSLSPLE